MASRIYTFRFSIALVERGSGSIGKNDREVVHAGTRRWMTA